MSEITMSTPDQVTIKLSNGSERIMTREKYPEIDFEMTQADFNAILQAMQTLFKYNIPKGIPKL